MNPVRIVLAMLLAGSVALLQGCVVGDMYIEDHIVEGAGYGAVAGAATGAAVADYNGTSRWQGAAYGAAGGAVIGGAIGSQVPPDPPQQYGGGVSVVPIERRIERQARP